MYAVIVRVTISDVERAREELQNRVVPMVAQAPGFVSGYWTGTDRDGLSMVIFESQDAARQMADRVPQTVPEFVKLDTVDVREVVASA